MKKYDLAIIGAGPVGLFAASFANLHGLKTICFDALEEVGGQINMLYPQKNIKDIPAFPSIKGKDLISQLLKQNVDTNFLLSHKVKNISFLEDKNILIDEEYQVKSLLIATGLGAFKPKMLPLATTSETKSHIHYSMQHPEIFANKKVAILGGGDSALDWAMELANTSDIFLIHRRNEFRGLESSVNKLKSLKNVELLTPYLPKELQFNNNRMELVLHKVGKNDDFVTRNIDEILVAYGFKSDNRQLRKWGIKLENNLISVSQQMRTNLSNVYAIGDAVTYPGRVPMIALGFGEAQIAISNIMQDLFPEKTMTFHSTSI
ncbi:NAD(P)/FAD-dependent oxidoreductase [Lactobacillus isalae]|uniref:NAD(P)/FAD-dependent oxidoreductase n=1 Tax=Lactobacillus isalae TaxID=2993455 RepID=UPI0023C1A44A|nr:NAD(P)/FAD-dependent oxidoreductase [Lactobacillus isalae]MDE6546769.1 NAD(P)/FAD-dependent oxidoreductase [Lactobacillus sp.]